MALLVGVEDGSTSASYRSEKKNKISITRKTFEILYLVIAACSEDEDDVLSADGVPALFSTQRGATCIERTAKERQSVFFNNVDSILWEVKCSFDTDAASDSEDNNEQDPTAKTPKVRWTSENDEEVLVKDINGNVLETAAGEPLFASYPTACPILEVTRYEAHPYDHSKIRQYVNKLNSALFYGYPIGTAKMLSIDAEEEDLNNEKYSKVIYRIKFKLRELPLPVVGFEEDTWFLELLNAGQLYRKVAGAPPVVWMDEGGNTGIVNLAANGTLLAPGDPKIYNSYQPASKIDFNILGLGPF